MMLSIFAAAAVLAGPAVPATPAAESAFAATPPVDTATLDKAKAREDLAQIATSEQTSRVSNNTISGPSVTGSVAIAGNAFQNLSGLSVINANSGNNVSINAALTVNLQFSPAR